MIYECKFEIQNAILIDKYNIYGYLRNDVVNRNKYILHNPILLNGCNNFVIIDEYE